MLSEDEIRRAVHFADVVCKPPPDLTIHDHITARLADAVRELTEALEDAITDCSNPRQAPGEVLAKYKEALDD